jgi:V8-like Glu-specific endopeptidase
MMIRGSIAVPLLAAGVVLAGCSSSSSSSGAASSPQFGGASASNGTNETEVQNGTPAPSGYWTEERLLTASEFKPEDWSAPAEGSAPAAKENAKTLRVGAIFYGSNSSGGHFCTGSVVDSPNQDVIETAAHCLNDGKGGADKTDVAFVPAYADGKAPFGEWQPVKYIMDSRWINGADPDYDVAFVVLKPYQGKTIQQVLGGNTIAFNTGYDHNVRVTGYPGSADAPITCDNTTTKQDPNYLRFPCANFYGGTSGSPFLTDYNPQTRTGTIVGVLGGYEEGGSTADVSYSDYLGDGIKQLYDEAITVKG